MALYPSDIGGFVIGLSPIGILPEQPPTTTQNVIPSYLYVQYNDDESLQAFVEAQNEQAQAYLDWFNQTGILLAVYTSGAISGTLLDWVAAGVYGMLRPGLPTFGQPARGPFNTFTFNSLPFNGFVPAQGQTFYETSDDIFKRVLTWAFYKGDGRVFNVRWLKRRIARFLNGINGSDYTIDQTYFISVTFTGLYAVTITLPNSAEAVIFKAAVEGGALELPFQFTWTVTLV